MKRKSVDKKSHHFKALESLQQGGRAHHRFYGESFGMPHYFSQSESERVDSSCIHNLEEEHINPVQLVKTRTITLNDLQHSLDASCSFEKYITESPEY